MTSSNADSRMQYAYLNQMSIHSVLRTNLEDVLTHFRLINVLDINAGVSIAKYLFDQKGIESIINYPVNGNTDSKNHNDAFDDRIMLKPWINKSDVNGVTYNMMTFILCLPWIDNPEKVVKRLMSHTHLDYVLVSNPLPESDQTDNTSVSPATQQKDIDQFRKVFLDFTEKSCRLEKEITMQNYYPLISLREKVWFVLSGKNKYPTHILKTVLYSRDKPDRKVYDAAKYIFQVNTICNLKCPFCYVEKTNEQMNAADYLKYLQHVKAGELIALRGGEPFFSPNFMKDFLDPAIHRGIRVLVESNGQFMGMPNYKACLDMLAHENVEIRLSLDRDHFDYLEADIRKTRLERLATFLKDAETRNIKYSITALGLDKKQVQIFLKDIDFVHCIDHTKIKPLTKYCPIEDLPIKHSYIDVKGNEHNHIVDNSGLSKNLS